MGFGFREIVILVAIVAVVAIVAFFLGRIPVKGLEKKNNVLRTTLATANAEVRSANGKKVANIALLAQARKETKLATESAEVLHRLSGCTKEDTWADHTKDQPEGLTEARIVELKEEKAQRASRVNAWAKPRIVPKDTVRVERSTTRTGGESGSNRASTDATHYVTPVVAPVIVDTPVIDCSPVSVSCD